MLDLHDESGHQKLVDFLANDLAFLLIEAMQPLFHWLGTGCFTPCKHVGVCTEKVDEHGFLFGVEVGVDRQHLAIGAVGVEQDLLRSFCWLEAARVSLGL